MKKIVVAFMCALTACSFAGCASAGVQLENIDSTKTVKPEDINITDYKNDLDGLEKYFIKLNYIPDKTQPTEMMYKVIGAVDGDRYIFNVNNSNVNIELYEYDPDNLNEDARRVLGEIKENGEFHVFKDKSINGDTTYPGVISDNGKYMMIYIDSSNSEANTEHKKLVVDTFKAFYSSDIIG